MSLQYIRVFAGYTCFQLMVISKLKKKNHNYNTSITTLM